MADFIKTQYILYKSGGKSIGIDKIKQLANIFLTEDERTELFECAFYIPVTERW